MVLHNTFLFTRPFLFGANLWMVKNPWEGTPSQFQFFFSLLTWEFFDHLHAPKKQGAKKRTWPFENPHIFFPSQISEKNTEIVPLTAMLVGIQGHEILWCFNFLTPMDSWVVVSNMFYFHPYLGKIPILTNIFQMHWNHQPDKTEVFQGFWELLWPIVWCSCPLEGEGKVKGTFRVQGPIMKEGTELKNTDHFMGSNQNLRYLLHKRDDTTLLYRDYDKPFSGSLVTNQDSMGK